MKLTPFLISSINFLLIIFIVLSKASLPVILFSFLEVVAVVVIANVIAERKVYSNFQDETFPNRITNDFF